MIFGPTPLEEARGAVLAHTLRLPGKVLKKGTVPVSYTHLTLPTILRV